MNARYILFFQASCQQKTRSPFENRMEEENALYIRSYGSKQALLKKKVWFGFPLLFVCSHSGSEFAKINQELRHGVRKS